MLTMGLVGMGQLDQAMRGPSMIEALVTVQGSAARYARVWEWGAVWRTRPGPKTTWGTNPRGERVILTIRAPQGYVNVNRYKYILLVKREVQKALKALERAKSLEDWVNGRLRQAMDQAGLQCAAVISNTAPKDTGALKSQVHVELRIL